MIESVQRRAARFVTSTYNQTSSVTAMLFRLGWPSLEQRSEIAKATMMYKILRNIVTVPFDQYRHLLLSSQEATHNDFIKLQHTYVNAYLCSFIPSAIKLWNSLPESVIQARDVEEFRKLIRNYYYYLISWLLTIANLIYIIT